MIRQPHWRLPDGVDELLPPEAGRLERLRRQVLDVFRGWGFEYVEPPLIEYLDALLVGSGHDLDLQTLKVVDQRTGRLLGVRADMTSQAARIDAHGRPSDGVQRLCYAGSVVHANPAAVLDSRVPLKAGAEIFGSPSLSADAEVVALLVAVLETAGVAAPLLVLGHMGIYRGLVAALGLGDDEQRALFSAVQSKSESDIGEQLGDRDGAGMLVRLPTLMGRQDVLDDARQVLRPAPPAVAEALDALTELAELVAARCPGVELRFDLAELAGYGYHNGPVFSAYQADRGRAVARGGRYDGIGAVFGRGRPATGFDVSLKELVAPGGALERAIWAPWVQGGPERRALQAALTELRSTGEIVIAAVSAEDAAPERCDRTLVATAGNWVVRPLGR
ncbi:MAG: ATP phosphoribosyltransferase regulatory subunit [Pseudomonadales bacterium]